MNVTIELTTDEVLYIRKHITFDGGYQWEKELVDNLEKKLAVAVERPVMTEKELSLKLSEYRRWWRKRETPEDVIDAMTHAKEYELRFRCEIREAV